MPEAWYNQQDIVRIDQRLIDQVKREAALSPKKRARFCLHTDDQAGAQEMVIAVLKGTYVRPHKHPAKTESFHVIEGRFWLFVFDDAGKVIEKFKMGERGKEDIFLYRCERNIWHSIIPLTRYVVFHEVTQGPFVKTEASCFPAWAPAEDQKAASREFQNKLLKMCR